MGKAAEERREALPAVAVGDLPAAVREVVPQRLTPVRRPP